MRARSGGNGSAEGSSAMPLVNGKKGIPTRSASSYTREMSARAEAHAQQSILRID